MPLYTANAIVLRRINYGEIDRIVSLYTRERGKISGIAKGARKPVSRLSGATEVLTYGRFQLATGKNLDAVAQIEVKESFPGIRADLNKTAWGTYMAELVNTLVEEHEPNANLFDLILSSLYLLERPNDPDKIAHMFELKLMKALGYEPVLDRCVRCPSGRALQSANSSPTGVASHDLTPGPTSGDVYFSPSLGGIVCRECGPLPEDAIQLSPQTRMFLERLLKATAPEVERLEIPRFALDQIARAMRWYIRYRAERELKSTEFLQALRVISKQ